jgi:hypothetical protein
MRVLVFPGAAHYRSDICVGMLGKSIYVTRSRVWHVEYSAASSQLYNPGLLQYVEKVAQV